MSLKVSGRTEEPRLELRALGWPQVAVGAQAPRTSRLPGPPELISCPLGHSNLSLGTALTTVPAGVRSPSTLRSWSLTLRLCPALAFKTLPYGSLAVCLVPLDLSLYSGVSKGQTQVVRLGGKCFYPMSSLTDPSAPPDFISTVDT